VKRLLVVSPLAEVAGGEMMLLRILPLLKRRGWRVRLAVPGGGELRAAARREGIDTVPLPLGPPAKRTLSSYVGAGLAPFVAGRSDVVFLNGLSTQRVARTLRATGRRAVLRVNNPLDEPPAAWSRPGFWEFVRSVIADSRYSADQCLAAGAPAERVHVVFPAAWAGERPPRSEREPGQRVGFVGQIEPRKGVLELIKAAESFLAERPEATLDVVGAPPAGHESYGNEVRTAAATSRVSDRIRLHGYRDDGAALIAGFDLLAVPSKAEPYGTVAAEAAAAGVPVVAGRAGGLQEVVYDGETGQLVPPGDAEALGNAIGELLDAPERRQQLGARAYELAERFAPEPCADAVEKLLEEAAAGDAPARERS
jgi:glycosyltransferase involved in cell wall biosynthesis